MVAVDEGRGRWRISLFQATPAARHGAPAPARHSPRNCAGCSHHSDRADPGPPTCWPGRAGPCCSTSAGRSATRTAASTTARATSPARYTWTWTPSSPRPPRPAAAATRCPTSPTCRPRPPVGRPARPPVVVYDANGGSPRPAPGGCCAGPGSPDVRLLDGGLAAWTAAAAPLEPGTCPRRSRATSTLTGGAHAGARRRRGRRAARAGGRAARRPGRRAVPRRGRAGRPAGRAHPRRGQRADRASNLAADGRFRPAEELRARFARAGRRGRATRSGSTAVPASRRPTRSRRSPPPGRRRALPGLVVAVVGRPGPPGRDRAPTPSVQELEPEDAADDPGEQQHLDRGHRLLAGRHREGDGERRRRCRPRPHTPSHRQSRHRLGESGHAQGERAREEDRRARRGSRSIGESGGPDGLQDASNNIDDRGAPGGGEGARGAAPDRTHRLFAPLTYYFNNFQCQPAGRRRSVRVLAIR